ncbi:MAG: tail fiber protein [Bdellovibrionales bacterium]|nr:tail fiber protein [Bdellovibrionales bacterium]
MRSRKGSISVAELLVASGMAIGVSLIVGKVAQDLVGTQRKAADSYSSLELRDTIANLSRDPTKWLAFQNRADELNDASVFSNCLKKGGPYSCPAHDTTLDSKSDIVGEAGGRATFANNIYVPNRTDLAPSALVATDFTKIAGTPASPVYLDRDGKTCAGATNPKCLRMVTAYVMRQNATTNKNPGAISILIKMEQNPATLAANPDAFKTSYSRINVGTLWNGGMTGPIPVGSIIPFSGVAAQIPVGFLPCSGDLVLQATYPQLYDVIKTRWTPPSAAAPGVGQFYLPDLRGMYLRGMDFSSGAPIDPDRALRPSQPYQAQDILAHGHTAPNINMGSASGSGSGSLTVTGGSLTISLAPSFAHGGLFGSGFSIFDGGGGGQATMPAQPVSGAANISGAASGSATGGTLTIAGAISNTAVLLPSSAVAQEIRPPTAYVHYIIRADY